MNSLIITKGHFRVPKEHSKLVGQVDGLLEHLATTTNPSTIGLSHNGKDDKRKWWMVSFMPDNWKARLMPVISRVDYLIKLLLGPDYETDQSPAIIFNDVKTPR